MKLKISSAIANEWMSRGIGEVIPALDGLDYDSGTIDVPPSVVREIAEDCRFYIDPKAVDATVGERSAYRALLKQIEGA